MALGDSVIADGEAYVITWDGEGDCQGRCTLRGSVDSRNEQGTDKPRRGQGADRRLELHRRNTYAKAKREVTE